MLSASLLLTAVLGRRHRRRTGDRLLQSSFGSERKYRFNFSSSKSASEKGGARAPRPHRSATRRPERGQAPLRKGRRHWWKALSPFLPASRRTAQAGRLCYPATNFQTRSKGATVQD